MSSCSAMALHLPFMPVEAPPCLIHSRSTPSFALSTSYLPAAAMVRSPAQLPRVRCPPVRPRILVSVGKEGTELRRATGAEQPDASPEDLEYVRQIQTVLELLRKNRDMLFDEVKLTIMIEDPRDVERKRLLGLDPYEVTRDDLVVALEEVNEGRIPENHAALRLLAKEMNEWPDLEVEVPKRSKPSKSVYAKATDTGVDPQEAAKRLNMDWDSAADIELEEQTDDVEVPPAVGYGALYLVTALPIIIGISVVVILFYNSLQ